MNNVSMSYDKPSAIRIRDFLFKQGLTIEGVYGMMANIYVESGFRSNNAQNSCVKKLGWTDEEYTAKVDSGEYQNFVTDRIGYGLWQSTSSGRKQGLLNYAKSLNKSIGDESMQLDYLMIELTTAYKAVLNVLKTSHDISECAKYVMTKFERPANQSEENQNKRASYGLQLYEDLEDKKEVYMGYTNSPLVNYIKISPNKTSPRNHIIDTITIHCYVGQVSVERIGKGFAKSSRKASCNYGIGSDGRIALIVEEKDRSWCSDSKTNDHRAITIEVASDSKAPYAVNDKVMDSLIKLVADICDRNNIKELKWQGNKALIGQVDKQNMTVHRWFANKSCPGQFLYDKHGYIASEVNKLLGVANVVVPDKNTTVAPSPSYNLEQFIKDVQKTIGVTVDGIVGSKTLSALPTVSKSKNNKHAVVKPLQRYLTALGFDCGTADGVAGTKFDTAAKAWAKANGCTADGEFTQNGKSWKVILGYNSTSSTAPSVNTNTPTSSTSKYVHNGLDYSIVFDPTYYANKYSDLKNAFGTNATMLFSHFVEYGIAEGRQGISSFDVNIYKNRYADLQQVFGNDLPSYYRHYIEFGQKEGRTAV